MCDILRRSAEHWDDGWVREVEVALGEYIDDEKENNTTVHTYDFSPLYALVYHHLIRMRHESTSHREKYLQVCQLLCKPQLLVHSRDIAILSIMHILCNHPQHGERDELYKTVFDMAMQVILDSFKSMNLISIIISGDFTSFLTILHRFVEIVIRLEESAINLMKTEPNEECLLKWWPEIFIVMKEIPSGDLLQKFCLEVFLNDLKVLQRFDFNLEIIKKAVDGCFPGRFNTGYKSYIPLVRILLQAIGTIYVKKWGFYEGNFFEKGRLQMEFFCYFDKSGIGQHMKRLMHSPGILTTQGSLVNFDTKKILMKLLESDTFKQIETAKLKWSMQDLINCSTVDEKLRDLTWYIQEQLESNGMKSKRRSFHKLFRLVKGCTDATLNAPQTLEEVERLLLKLNDEVSQNWLRRNSLHLLALVCYTEEVYVAVERACPDVVKYLVACRDVHGSTPYLLACICKNKVAMESFLRMGAQMGEDDYFGNTDKYLLDQSYLFLVRDHNSRQCVPLIDLVYDLNDREKIIQYVKRLFEMMVEEMVKINAVLGASVKIAGSVREQTKVGRMDEFDVQIIFTQLSQRINLATAHTEKDFEITFDRSGEFCENLISEKGVIVITVLLDYIHQGMQNILKKIPSSGIPFRVVDIAESDPWLMIYEGKGESKGMLVSFDVVPVIEIPDSLLQVMASVTKLLLQ